MGVQDFYESIYRGDKPKPKPSLYSRVLTATLGRLLVNRYDMTYEILPGGDTILDIGCGDDLRMMPLADKYNKIYGIDISPTRIERMQQQYGNNPNIKLSVQDINDVLDFQDAFFDTVIALAVMEHILDPYHFMEECRRLLKPQGCCIVHVPNAAWIGNRLRLLAGRIPVTSGSGDDWAAGHLHYYTRSKLKKVFREYGFRVARFAYGGPSRRLWGSLLSNSILVVGIKQ
jgi:SAM-dependent methyltransferase